MKTADGIPYVEAIPEERRLVRRAQWGDSQAFLDLYDAYSDDLYRYIYFRVLSDVAAEGITSQVLRHAWEHLGAFRWRKQARFVDWIYRIARTQVLIYYNANLKTTTFNIGSLLDAADYRLNEESQSASTLGAWSSHLRLLTGDIEQSRLQTTAALIMRKYLEYLNPGRVTKPSPTFNAYTRTWLARYLELHPRPTAQTRIREWARSARARLPAIPELQFPKIGMPLAAQRLAVAYAVLVLALLATGTARAQAAMPGDVLYGWKRTSEQAWLSVSPDPVGTAITLADRRLDELLAVENDPLQRASAQDAYVKALADLNTSADEQARVRIRPVLADHKKKLKDSGVSSSEVDAYFAPATGVEAGSTTPGQDTSVISANSTAATTDGASASASGSNSQDTTAVVDVTSVPVPTDTVEAAAAPTDVPPTDAALTAVAPTTTAEATVAPTDVTATDVAPTTASEPTTPVDATPTPDTGSIVAPTPTPSG